VTDEFLGHGNPVDVLASDVEVLHAPEDAPVTFHREIIGF
jgi:hypothetical protein